MIVRFGWALLALWAILFATSAQAQVSFELRTGNATTGVQSMAIDSNKCNVEGPRAAFVGGLLTNSGGSTINNITATLSGLDNGFVLAGGQGAAQSIGSLDPGQSTGVYWFIGYGCTAGATSSPTITLASSAGSSSATVTLTARSAISANAGGRVTSSTLGPGAVVGQTIFFDATYEFGGGSSGDEYFLQPSGGQNFDAACFRLVSSEIRSSNVTAISSATQNRQYFVATTAQPGNGYAVTVRYNFEYQCAGAATTARPYAVQTSGSSNIKYTGNFDGSGSISMSFPGATNPFTIAKTSDISSAVGVQATTVKYTITVTNPSIHASRISQFTDVLPSGATYIGLDPASDVTVANSSSVPTAGSAGTLNFVGRQDQSYLIAAGSTVSLIYTVSIPATAGTYVNSAHAAFGQVTTGTASANFTVIAVAPIVVVKSSQVSTDPQNGTTNPKAIPGSRVAYAVQISNPNPFTITNDSIIVLDPTPPNLRAFVTDIGSAGSGPVLFQDGSASSGLTYTFTSLASQSDDVDFSSDGGTTWTYVPTPDSQGADPQVTHIRIRPKGAMAASSSLTFRFGYVVQ